MHDINLNDDDMLKTQSHPLISSYRKLFKSCYARQLAGRFTFPSGPLTDIISEGNEERTQRCLTLCIQNRMTFLDSKKSNDLFMLVDDLGLTVQTASPVLMQMVSMVFEEEIRILLPLLRE